MPYSFAAAAPFPSFKDALKANPATEHLKLWRGTDAANKTVHRLVSVPGIQLRIANVTGQYQEVDAQIKQGLSDAYNAMAEDIAKQLPPGTTGLTTLPGQEEPLSAEEAVLHHDMRTDTWQFLAVVDFQFTSKT